MAKGCLHTREGSWGVEKKKTTKKKNKVVHTVAFYSEIPVVSPFHTFLTFHSELCQCLSAQPAPGNAVPYNYTETCPLEI